MVVQVFPAGYRDVCCIRYDMNVGNFSCSIACWTEIETKMGKFQWSGKEIQTQLRLFGKIVADASLECGSKAWTTKKNYRSRLLAVEMRSLQKIPRLNQEWIRASAIR